MTVEQSKALAKLVQGDCLVPAHVDKGVDVLANKSALHMADQMPHSLFKTTRRL